MEKFVKPLFLVTLTFSSAIFAVAQHAQTAAPQSAAREATPQAGRVFMPESSIERPEDQGLRAHTNYVVRTLDGAKPQAFRVPQALGAVGPLATTEEAETPQSLGCLYVKSPATAGCVPNYNSGSGGPASAGYGAIALVDAYDNPQALADLTAFDNYWGLPAAKFAKVIANGNGACTKPPANANWALESSLDIEYAHVFAPKAAIILVEACSNSYTDLFYAEQVAFQYIVAHYPNGGQVSNSWGGSEFSGQIGSDLYFAEHNYSYTQPIMAFVSAGDAGLGAQYPSTNPWVVSAGGTSILRDATAFTFSSESCWGGSGGGVSAQETYTTDLTAWTGGNMGPWANYQYPVFGQSARVTPDLAFDADPASGAWIYSGYGAGGWAVVGGTSLSSPALAGIVNRAGNRTGSAFFHAVNGSTFFTNGENDLLYAQLPNVVGYKNNFYDITTGSNGSNAAASYDECTGVGSPRGLLGK
jgi:kumamolisin